MKSPYLQNSVSGEKTRKRGRFWVWRPYKLNFLLFLTLASPLMTCTVSLNQNTSRVLQIFNIVSTTLQCHIYRRTFCISISFRNGEMSLLRNFTLLCNLGMTWTTFKKYRVKDLDTFINCHFISPLLNTWPWFATHHSYYNHSSLTPITP